VNPPSPDRAPLPGLRLPLGQRRLGPGAALAVFLHVVIVAALVIRGREILGRGQGGSRASGQARVNFFAIPAGAPAAVEMALSPRLTLSDLSALRRIHVELPPLALPQATLPVPTVAPSGGGGNAGGGAGGRGTGSGAAVGVGVGPGTEGEAGYIVRAQPRRVLPLVPKCASAGALEVRFWVGADGRPTRVELDPLPADERCRREFVDQMMGTSFYPARRNGQPVASVYSIRYSRRN